MIGPLACGHVAQPTELTPGHARWTDARHAPDTGALMPAGAPCCYACTDRLARQDAETAPAILAYDTGGRDVLTWSGGILARVLSRSTYRNGLTGSRMTALRVRTAGGRILSGRYGSDWSQAVTLRPARRAKEATR